jgi:anti-anti-sigma factor
VHLAGELDIATTPLLVETLHASRRGGLRARVVVLDMRELEFVDTSGLHAIMEAGNRARETGDRLVLVRGPPAVDRVFRLTGSCEQLEIVDLEPVESVVMALLHLAQADRAA